MNLPHKISIADDFSTVPLGRFPDDSPFNGTTFREIWLIPALAKYQSIEVDLDRAEGYGSSFLEEAFGGLVRLIVSLLVSYYEELALSQKKIQP
jgi:hypothetical protein